ncbi:MAG TPA: M20 family metallopeptidase [Candidatus Sulfotelmatobacter sp.]|nr:M20 family metallopeptidase [Candidatus Sulfotelmatobacter sp.]
MSVLPSGTALQEARRLLAELIAIPSYAPPQEEAIAHYLIQRLSRQGIRCRATEADGKPLNVVAEIGEGPRAIVLNSHLDTVPPGDPALWATDPLSPVEKAGCLYGRGAGDAKGPLAAMVLAFEALARASVLPGRVILMAVGAEERGGLGTQAEVARGVAAQAAIIGESTGLVPMVAHKGVLRLEIEVQGKAAHASAPDAGVNAIVAMAPVIQALADLATTVERRSERYTGRASLVISTITGGVALNVIPARCMLSIDRRVLPTETEADATREIVRAAEQALPQAAGARLAWRKVRFVPPAVTDASERIVRVAESVCSRLLERPVTAEGFTATCDMTYLVNQAKIPTIILGPGSLAVAHQANEQIALDQVALGAQAYRETVESWLAEG